MDIPTQMGSEKEVETVNEQGSAASSGTKASGGSNFFVNVLLSGSMNQVWSMINGL